MDLDSDKINNINLSKFVKFIEHQQSEQEISFLLGDAGREHYKLLAYLSTLYDNEILIDLGTYRGLSALALSYNKKNKVVTFDIEKCTGNNNNQLKPDNCYNIIFMLDNILEFPNRYMDLLKKAKIICLDVDPHDGIKEPDFLKIIIESGFKGIIVCDDINLNNNMKNWWNSVTLEKYDISKYGHWSGTGLIQA
jgi:predicted O-methyltransferase YrrM